MLPKPDDCIGCGYYDHWQKDGFVPGKGLRRMGGAFLVGEAGGEHEETKGEPFVGGTGRVLRRWIHEAGLDPKDFYITNIVKCRPPGNEDPASSAIAHCSRYLDDELRSLRPNLIVAVGRFALERFTRRTKIQNVVGYTFPYTFEDLETKVLVLGHPSWVMRMKNTPKGKTLWAMHVAFLRKVPRLLAVPGWSVPPEPFNTNPSLQDVIDFAHRVKDKLTLDIENTMERRRRCILLQVGLGIPDELYISINMDPTHWVDYEYEEMVRWLGGMLACPLITKRGHNLPHDIEVLEYHGYEVAGPYEDTILAHHVVYGEMRHALGIIAPLYTDREYWKDQAPGWTHEEK